LKRTHLALACLLFVASFSDAQNSSQPPPPDENPASSSSQPPSSSTQAPAPNPQAGQPTQSGDQSQDKDKPATAQGSNATDQGTSKDRLFFALPNFLTLENAGKLPPLTTGQKFKVVAQGSFDPIQIVWYAALSGLSQAENSEPGFGQGAAGYGKRFGAYAADGTIENFFVGAIFPSMLRQDPRYFQNGHGSFFHRTTYAVSRIFITRTDAGPNQFNYSEIVGAGVASAISTYSYHPHPGYHPGQTTPYIPSDRTFDNTLSVWGTQVGYDTLTLVIKEFWPDIRRSILKKHRQASGSE
jgi:hypothetical protein